MTSQDGSIARRAPRCARHAQLALAAVLASGCAPSVLIRADDTAYRHSIERFQRTRVLVAASSAATT